jgi:hypothetical protein
MGWGFGDNPVGTVLAAVVPALEQEHLLQLRTMLSPVVSHCQVLSFHCTSCVIDDIRIERGVIYLFAVDLGHHDADAAAVEGLAERAPQSDLVSVWIFGSRRTTSCDSRPAATSPAAHPNDATSLGNFQFEGAEWDTRIRIGKFGRQTRRVAAGNTESTFFRRTRRRKAIK